jgi:hypothetical protein
VRWLFNSARTHCFSPFPAASASPLKVPIKTVGPWRVSPGLIWVRNGLGSGFSPAIVVSRLPVLCTVIRVQTLNSIPAYHPQRVSSTLNQHVRNHFALCAFRRMRVSAGFTRPLVSFGNCAPVNAFSRRATGSFFNPEMLQLCALRNRQIQVQAILKRKPHIFATQVLNLDGVLDRTMHRARLPSPEKLSMRLSCFVYKTNMPAVPLRQGGIESPGNVSDARSCLDVINEACDGQPFPLRAPEVCKADHRWKGTARFKSDISIVICDVQRSCAKCEQ